MNYIVRPSPFYPGIFSGMSPSVGSAEGPPVRLAGGHFASFLHRCPQGTRRNEGRIRCRWPARLGTVDVFLSICSPWKVGIDAFGIPFPGSRFDRVVVVHFNLDYSYPNMKNSDISLGKAS